MKSVFIDILLNSLLSNSDKIAIVDQGGKRKTTYKDLLLLARQVTSYIKSKNIDVQSFVGIQLPSSLEFVAAEIGIWLSRCIAVPMGENYPQSRVDYIINHCESPLLIDSSIIRNIRELEPSDGEIPNSTDNALILYTSGSTGNPKGALHTFEPLDNCAPRKIAPGFDMDNVIFGTSAPLYFAFGNNLWDVLQAGGTVHIYSDELKNNVSAMEQYILDNGITVSLISPAVLKLFKNKSPKLKVVITAGEKLTTQYSKDGYTLFNLFGQTEALHAIIGYEMPEHQIETIPIGKCLHGLQAKVVDEDGIEVPNGVVGEMCLKGPLFKEYYKAPELTREIYDGEWLHTKDLVYVNEDNDIVYVNRKDWMVKVNGQRVEPGEVEAAMHKIDGIIGAVVKGFDNNEGSQYLCAFYISDTVKSDDLRKKLAEVLPTYMVPSYFVKMSEFPINANGKIDRKALTEPCINDISGEYVAPANEMEESICKAFSDILGIEKVGTNDDFVNLGGDSIKMMRLVLACQKLGLTYEMINAQRTPQNIATALVSAQQNNKGESVHNNSEDTSPNSELINSKKMYVVNILLDLLPNSGMQKIKTKLLRWAGVKVGDNVVVFQGVKIQGIGEVEIGNNVFIGHQTMIMINDGSKVIFEDYSSISSRNVIVAGFHKITPNGNRIISDDGTHSIIRFCKGCGVSVGCTILPGVTIGEKALVSAGTVVNADVKPYSLVGQMPAITHIEEGQLKFFGDNLDISLH